VSSGCAGHGGGGGDVPRRRRGMEAELARRSSTAARRVGADSDSGGAPIALRKVEGERQLNPKENHVKAARRWLSPWRGQLGDNGDSTKFPTRGAASSDRVQTLASTERGEGRQRGPWWRLHGQQGRGKKGAANAAWRSNGPPTPTRARQRRASIGWCGRGGTGGASVGRSGERRKENGSCPME
jgi:hypothetical protein